MAEFYRMKVHIPMCTACSNATRTTDLKEAKRERLKRCIDDLLVATETTQPDHMSNEQVCDVFNRIVDGNTFKCPKCNCTYGVESPITCTKIQTGLQFCKTTFANAYTDNIMNELCKNSITQEICNRLNAIIQLMKPTTTVKIELVNEAFKNVYKKLEDDKINLEAKANYIKTLRYALHNSTKYYDKLPDKLVITKVLQIVLYNKAFLLSYRQALYESRREYEKLIPNFLCVPDFRIFRVLYQPEIEKMTEETIGSITPVSIQIIGNIGFMNVCSITKNTISNDSYDNTHITQIYSTDTKNLILNMPNNPETTFMESFDSKAKQTVYNYIKMIAKPTEVSIICNIANFYLDYRHGLNIRREMGVILRTDSPHQKLFPCKQENFDAKYVQCLSSALITPQTAPLQPAHLEWLSDKNMNLMRERFIAWMRTIVFDKKCNSEHKPEREASYVIPAWIFSLRLWELYVTYREEYIMAMLNEEPEYAAKYIHILKKWYVNNLIALHIWWQKKNFDKIERNYYKNAPGIMPDPQTHIPCRDVIDNDRFYYQRGNEMSFHGDVFNLYYHKPDLSDMYSEIM